MKRSWMLVLTACIASVSVVMAAAAPAAERPLFKALGVCPEPSYSAGWAVVWHPSPAELDVVAANRLFKHLQGRDFDSCLVSIVEADPDAAALVRTLAREDVDYPSVRRAVFRAWQHAGVYEALEEVVRLGKRGPVVVRLLERCPSGSF